MALPRANRLRRRQDFKLVYQSGRRRTGSSLTVRCLRQLTNVANADTAKPGDNSTGQIATRFGISISQKVSKKAVVRNRIKRQIRAVLRQLLPRISPGWLVVVGVRPAACGCNYDEILRELEQLLVEAEVINGHARRGLL